MMTTPVPLILAIVLRVAFIKKLHAMTTTNVPKTAVILPMAVSTRPFLAMMTANVPMIIAISLPDAITYLLYVTIVMHARMIPVMLLWVARHNRFLATTKTLAR
jgi:hypothetical protein